MAAAPITLPTTTRASMTDQNDYDDACFGFERCLETALTDCKILEGLEGQQAKMRISR
jgi:hypothetical protein